MTVPPARALVREVLTFVLLDKHIIFSCILYPRVSIKLYIQMHAK